VRGDNMHKLDLGLLIIYQDLADWKDDRTLTDRAKTCIEAQKRAAVDFFQNSFKPDPRAGAAAVSEEALQSILRSGRDVHGIAKDRDISNVIVFNARNIDDSVLSTQVIAARKSVDDLVLKKIKQHFRFNGSLSITASGHFWYPPGAYMGWHTNSGAPGWRMYISHAEEPGKSFFRYRDPDTQKIITSLDDEWNVRLFEIRRDKPLWHAVYSDTNRFSLGYVIYKSSTLGLIRRLVKRVLK
jgi:hypothetical protein